ncbi:hypothetical protein NHQ30_000903 [Ciborinia camelliae]|nr:hypothetical protein NHQ30_000903 [Ciborinia camelliae]
MENCSVGGGHNRRLIAAQHSQEVEEANLCSIEMEGLYVNLRAEGRDDETIIPASQFKMSREIFVPQFEDGNLYYTLMEIVALSDFDSGWVVKDQQSAEFPISAEPAVANLTATDGNMAQVSKEPVVSTQKDS